MAQVLDYYPFGDIRLNEQESSFDEQRKFTGHEFDSDTDLNYMVARYQNPSIGRFISVDPAVDRNPQKFLKNPQLLNSYSYARNNPLILVDLDGETPVLIAVMAGGALAGMGGQAVADLMSGSFSGWSAYASAAVGGSAGAITSLVNPILGGAVGGLVTETMKQSISVATDNQSSIDGGEILSSATVGGLTGALSMPKMQGITVGKGSMGAVTKQMLTKSSQGQISGVSLNTFGKVTTYTAVDESPGLLGSIFEGRNRNNLNQQNFAPIGDTIRSADSNSTMNNDNTQQNRYNNSSMFNSYYSNSTQSILP